MPERIQRKRERGWRMPPTPGAIYVGRPTKWGNRAAIEAVVGVLGRYAQQFGEGTNPRIALTVAAEGVRDLEVGR